MKYGKIAQTVSETKAFKIYKILYMNIAKGQGQITLRRQNIDYNLNVLLL